MRNLPILTLAAFALSSLPTATASDVATSVWTVERESLDDAVIHAQVHAIRTNGELRISRGVAYVSCDDGAGTRKVSVATTLRPLCYIELTAGSTAVIVDGSTSTIIRASADGPARWYQIRRENDSSSSRRAAE